MNKLKTVGKSLAVLAVLSTVFLSSSFVTYEHELSMIKRFGKVEKNDAGEVIVYGSGLNFKLPFFDRVMVTDVRTRSFIIENARFMTSEKKDLVLDSVITYKVVEPLKFFTSTNGGVYNTAEQRMKRLFIDSIKTEIGKYQILEVSSGATAKIISNRSAINNKKVVKNIEGKRDLITANILKSVLVDIKNEYGIQVIDFRFNSLSLPREIEESIFRRMRTERETVAKRFRAEGKKRSTEIKSNADFSSNTIIETAKQESLRIRGEALADVNKIYIDAYSKNIDLYNFMKAMESYSSSLNSKDNIIFLNSDMPYFRELYDKANLK